MPALCVAEGTIAGSPALVPDPACSAGLVVVPQDAYQAMAWNPLLIPMDAAIPMMVATMGLFVAAFTAKAARRAIE